MIDFKALKKILEIIEKKGLFNQFISDLLNYKLINFNRIIIRYKVEDDFIIDIFDYNEDNKFIRYYFVKDNIVNEINDDNVVVNVISLRKYYEKFNKNNKYSLFSSIFYEKDIEKINNNLEKIFNEDIKNIIMKHLKN